MDYRSNNVPCTVENVARSQPSVSHKEDKIQNSNFEHVPSKRPSVDPEEDDRKPAAKRIKKEPEDDAQNVTQDEPKVETTVKLWEDKKDYEAIFRKYIYIGDDGEEYYDVIDMERDAQRAVRRITDHQEIVKQYQKVVRAYNNFMRDYPWMTDGQMQDHCRIGDLLKDEKRKSQFKYELGRLMGEYAVPLPLSNFSLNNKKTRRLELWKNRRGMWFDHVEHMEEGPEQNKEWENFWWTVDEDMFTYVMKTKIEELIDEKLNQEFPEEVEIRENQHYDSEEEVTSETEETDDDEAVTPDGFQKIRVHFVYAVKHDGRFKTRLVADGHLTKEPVKSIYSGVVSLRSFRMVGFLSQLNDLEIWGADVGNAYLEAYTDEKLCIVAGPEFKELQGHLLIMIKALYGTHSGGARWHDRLFDILQELKFKPSKADPDVWMRPEPGGTCYEYIAVYVDDLAIAAKDPQAFCNELKKKYNLKLKGVGPLEYHFGCTYKKDPDGTLAADPRRSVNKILESYERMFKEKPRKFRPPLEGGDHPELDTSELCDDHQTKQFQTLIGQLQWLISLSRFDIAVHVMSLSRFRAQPRKGHLDRAKRIVGYLLFLPDGAIRFRTGEPDFSSLKYQEYDWTRSVYSGACEQIPHDIPKPLGKHVQTTHYVDANLHHDLATGKAVTAALYFLNQTPIDAYTKSNLQLKLQPMDLNLLLQGQQLTRSLTFAQPCDILEFPSKTRVTCLRTTDQLLPALPFPTPPSPKDTIWHPIIESGKQLQLNTSHSIGKMAKPNLLTSSANIGSLQLCGPCSSLSCSGGARLPPS